MHNWYKEEQRGILPWKWLLHRGTDFKKKFSGAPAILPEFNQVPCWERVDCVRLSAEHVYYSFTLGLKCYSSIETVWKTTEGDRLGSKRTKHRSLMSWVQVQIRKDMDPEFYGGRPCPELVIYENDGIESSSLPQPPPCCLGPVETSSMVAFSCTIIGEVTWLGELPFFIEKEFSWTEGLPHKPISY